MASPAGEAGAVAIVGAGIAGCTLAWRLVEAGRTVLLVDAAPGSGASGNAWALLHVPSGQGLDNALIRAATRLARERICALQLLASALLTDRSGDVLAVQPAALLTALRQAAGTALTPVTANVSAIQRESTGWRVMLGDGKTSLNCADVVLANGPDAARLWPALAPLLRPVRGQVDLFSCLEPRGPAVLRSADGYAVAGGDGRWLVGASFQPGRTDLACDPADTAVNRARWAALLQRPAESLGHMSGRAALRVVSPDRRPLAGAAVAHAGGWQRNGWPLVEPGLWLSLAHGAHGFSTAFLAADWIARQCAGAPAPDFCRLAFACDPGRFGRR